MLDTNKLNSKNKLNNKHRISSNNDTLVHPIKRYKSQEVYLISRKRYQSKENSESMPINPNKNSNDIYSKNLHIHTFTKGKKLLSPENNVKNSNQSLKEKFLSPESRKNSTKISSYQINKPKQSSKTPKISKIMKDESIRELDTEENIDSLDENDQRQMDEIRTSVHNTDYNINSQEEQYTLMDKGKQLINNIPQPFVKPFKSKLVDNCKTQENIADNYKSNNIMTSKKKPPKRTNNRGSAKNITTVLKEKLFSKNENIFENEELTVTNSNLNENKISMEATQKKLIICAKKGDRDAFLECLELILSNVKGDINYKDNNGWTALHHACDEGNFKIVDILINTNVDVNCKTNNKKSPLHITVSHGFFDISKLLVENGTIINSLDDEKNTPIHICSTIGHIELLKYLLERFPQADGKNIYGKTPVDLAKKEDIRCLLQEYLNKNQSQYHIVHIHTTNNKSANILFKNLNSENHYLTAEPNNNTCIQFIGNNTNCNNKLIKSQFKYHNSHGSQGSIFTNPINPFNKFSLESYVNPQHSKYQSNDFNSKPKHDQNYNIEIKMNNNINQTGGGVLYVANLNNTPNTKKIKINDKVIEKKMDSNVLTTASSNNSKPATSIKSFTQTSTSVKFNTSNTNNYISNKYQSGIKSKIKNRNSLPTNTQNNSKKKNITKTFRNMNLKKHEKALSNNLKKIDIKSTSSDTARIEGLSSPININSKVPTGKITGCKILYKLENSYTNNLEFNLNEQPPDKLVINKENFKSNSISDEKDDSQMNSIDEDNLGPSAFVCHALLGKGSFGDVYLVEKKNAKTLYAMKVLSKDKIMGQNLVKYAMTERNVLSITNHPFIVKLNFSFQTSDKLFLILDYCPGGDLAEHLQKENRFTENRAKIYLCEILLALEDLHKRDIIFRDLKPDNVVIDSEGHAQLTDFGLSKEGVFDSKSAKSFCGSISYLAPEMLKRTGHGKAVDWYLLGVLFYEMLVGIPPYFNTNKEKLFQNIEEADLQIPQFVSEDAASLLKALLQKEPQQRLGSGADDASEIKMHKYFKDVDWEYVYERKLQPPIPEFTNRIFKKLINPLVFEETKLPSNFCPNSQFSSHFEGWSFVKTEEQNAVNNYKIK